MTKEDKPLELTGIDVTEALKRLKVNTDIYEKSLKAFAESYIDAVNKIQTALNKHNDEGNKETRELLHTLRGAALNIGAYDVENSASKVGIAIKAKNKNLKPLIDDLEKKLNIVLNSIHSIKKD